MKVAIAAESPEGEVSPLLGRAPYFVIYDTETSEKKVIRNPYVNFPSGAGIQAVQMLARERVEAVITSGVPGPNAQYVLQMSGISVLNFSGSVRDAMEFAKSKRRGIPAPFHPPVGMPLFPRPMTKEEEMKMLEEEKKLIEMRLEEIRKRLKEIGD